MTVPVDKCRFSLVIGPLSMSLKKHKQKRTKDPESMAKTVNRIEPQPQHQVESMIAMRIMNMNVMNMNVMNIIKPCGNE